MSEPMKLARTRLSLVDQTKLRRLAGTENTSLYGLVSNVHTHLMQNSLAA